MMNENSKLWSGEFGDSYYERNIETIESIQRRKALLSTLLQAIPRPDEYPPELTLLELGCGEGANLQALYNLSYKSKAIIHRNSLFGCDVNQKALNVAGRFGQVFRWDITDPNASIDKTYDIILTVGTLIHIPPEHVEQTYVNIWNSLSRGGYAVICEYFSPVERVIEYQGRDNVLWARPFGQGLMENTHNAAISPKLVDYGCVRKLDNGVDDLDWWVIRKVMKSWYPSIDR